MKSRKLLNRSLCYVRLNLLHGTATLAIMIYALIFEATAYGAATQLLNDNFFQNPAELSLVNKTQIIAGNLFIRPSFEFNGTAPDGAGKVNSVVNDSLPYMLTAFRLNDKFVGGLNITPSGYGHVSWPQDSILQYDGTVTYVLYYRGAFQASYQVTDNLSLGAGFNLEWNKLAELDFVIRGYGNQINKISGLNYTGDVGLFYKINNFNYLTTAVYTPVNTLGYGTSKLGPVTTDNLSLNITQANVVYVGLQHIVSDKWQVAGKIYWSNWTIQKNIDFTNTTTGSYVVPTNWKQVWSFQANTRYLATEKVGLLASIMYETNPAPLATNAVGYPLAASGSLAAGLDLMLLNELSSQVLYSYGRFLPNSPISNANDTGAVTANFQAVVLQFIYKI